jgi:hypothetical protein
LPSFTHRANHKIHQSCEVCRRNDRCRFKRCPVLSNCCMVPCVASFHLLSSLAACCASVPPGNYRCMLRPFRAHHGVLCTWRFIPSSGAESSLAHSEQRRSSSWPTLKSRSFRVAGIWVHHYLISPLRLSFSRPTSAIFLVR